MSRPADPKRASPGKEKPPCSAGGFIGAEDGIRTRDPHLGKVMLGVHTVHDLRLRTSASTFCPPNTLQSRQFVEWSTYARLLMVAASADRHDHRTLCKNRRMSPASEMPQLAILYADARRISLRARHSSSGVASNAN